ncbi:MAG TPA: histidine phosphatase family protein [Pseudobdellovibrionaceae bacterium]|nr:histidine phosphatase family protein [Pseudobdellovibrionaceae bacterium]
MTDELTPWLTLLRHFQRDPAGGDALTTQGRSDAEKFSRHPRRPAYDWVGISPKHRTRESVLPLTTAASRAAAPPVVLTELDERRAHESAAEFENRVQHFLTRLDDELRLKHRAILICSHLDWLETAALFLSSDDTDLARGDAWTPGHSRHYQWQDGIWRRRAAMDSSSGFSNE